MNRRLIPTSVPALYARALAFERESASRYRAFAHYMRDLGREGIAEAFDSLERDESARLRTLDAGAARVGARELSPGGYMRLLVEAAPNVELAFPRVPSSAAEALGLALAAERRAENFYRNIAAHAQDSLIRSLATGLAYSEQCQVRQLKELIQAEVSLLDDGPAN